MHLARASEACFVWLACCGVLYARRLLPAVLNWMRCCCCQKQPAIIEDLIYLGVFEMWLINICPHGIV
jgi:hypothetical protein